MKIRTSKWMAGIVLTSALVVAQRDPRSFPFPDSADPQAVVHPEASPFQAGHLPRGTNDPLFAAQELLGRPTDTSLTVNIAPRKALEIYYEYGTKPGSYSGKTTPVVVAPDESKHTLIDKLKPDTEYYYRLRYREPDAKTFSTRAEHFFHTARASGKSFTFDVQFDPHMIENNNVEAYALSLKHMLADKPDFMIDLGDNFFSDRERPPSMPGVLDRVFLLRSYYDMLDHSVPLMLSIGNHEGEWGRNIPQGEKGLAYMDTVLRKKYFPNPEPNSFYSGSSINEPLVGLRQANYAWTWGDATFIVLDPYWHQPVAPELKGDWSLTLGREQYDWLKTTLETSKAKYKFVFSHNLIGGLDMKGAMRGGVEVAKYLENGGYNLDGTWGFDKARPGWAMPIHQLLVANNATIYFHGHDHLYVHQELDGLTYQEGPQPSRVGKFDATRAAKDYNYLHGTLVGGSGYIRVHVSPTDVKVEYIQTYLPSEEDATHKDGMVADSYTLKARPFNPASKQ